MLKSDKLVVGILAHVDAGKTTLSESILYATGSIRKLGRVDHKDAFLDTGALERARGITIFSKQAEFPLGDKQVTLLDTPGHVDFSAEMERTLQVLDYAILVINGADGVQSHALTLWKLLKYYHIPVFLFINKMDQEGTDRHELMQNLQQRLDGRCVDFSGTDPEAWLDSLAMCEESLMDEFLECSVLEEASIGRAIARRHVFPCYFGSALRVTGVVELLEGIRRYGIYPEYPEEFAAKIYKITRDENGSRLTHLKVTGGSLLVKMALTNQKEENPLPPEQVWQEKINQIRIYSGCQFQAVNLVRAGTVCAVTGLGQTRSGEGLGAEPTSEMPILEPVLHYQIELPQGCDAVTMLGKLRQLEEEEPHLHVVWDEATGKIRAQLMGEVEIEVLKSLILERFDTEVSFGTGSIVYKETIASAVIGMGHFEPLRHYAEVQLLMEPGEPGSGLQFASRCSEEMLAQNWQRLVLTHLEEKQHRGVLTGSEITDMHITLIGGRAHQKHTEGGDFRQATYRALRHGLKKTSCVLLEPVYEFRIELPTEYVGRALSDIQKMHGSFEPPMVAGSETIITGFAPVACMRDYQLEVISYSKGHGRLFCSLKGYEPCHNEEEVIGELQYDSEADLDNPTGSVFCTHGAGFVVGWQDVEQYIHIDCGIQLKAPAVTAPTSAVIPPVRSAQTSLGCYQDEAELEAIFARTYGTVKREKSRFKRTISASSVTAETYMGKSTPKKSPEQYLLVDGYNIVFAWEDLRALAEVNMDGARTKLMDLLCNYQGYKNMKLILVFDAYRVAGGQGSVNQYHNIHVIYTKEAETADQYIEKVVHQIGHSYDVTVATSDRLEQMIIWGSGAKRLSAQGLREEMEQTSAEIRNEFLLKPRPGERNLPFRELPLLGEINLEQED